MPGSQEYPQTAGELGSRSEIEEFMYQASDASEIGTSHQPSFARQVKDAFLTPGDTVADMLMRGSLEDDQIAPAVRIINLDLWLSQLEDAEPKGLKVISDAPTGTGMVSLTGLLQAAASGKARQQTLSGFTGGFMQLGQAAGGAVRRKMRGMFGRNDRGGESATVIDDQKHSFTGPVT